MNVINIHLHCLPSDRMMVKNWGRSFSYFIAKAVNCIFVKVTLLHRYVQYDKVEMYAQRQSLRSKQTLIIMDNAIVKTLFPRQR